jgi:ribonuclease BN (tRNA processing enzyme)
MRLDVIGAGPAYSDRPGSAGAAYLVRHDGAALLLDLGQGSFPRLAGIIDPATLEAVVISHLHPDHFIDLVALRHYLRWEPPRRRVRVIAPGGLADRLDALHADPGFTAAALDVEPLAEGVLTVGPFELEVARVTHTDSSFGFRVSGSGAAPGPVVAGAEHLDGPAVAALARRTGAGRVLLTHLQMGFDREATVASVVAGFDGGPVTLVDPGFATTIGP